MSQADWKLRAATSTLAVATTMAESGQSDSTPHIKPHPAPLLHATRQLALEPARCWYVGDDLRDVQAAHAAGMRAVAVEYGYLGTGSAPRDWNAHAVIAHPMELIAHL